MKITKPHCSKLDRIFPCPGSILPSDAPKEAGGPEAIMGRAKHAALSDIPLGRVPNIDAVASEYQVDRDEIEMAVRLGEKAWREVGVYFPSPEVERLVESSVCCGASDIVQAVIDDRGLQALRLGDWKTGWGDDAHPCQLKGYALGLVDEFGWPRNDVVSCFEIHTTHQQIDTTNLTREELEAFRAELAGIIKTAETTPNKLEYRAGAHCRWCPHRAGCVTRNDWLRGAVTALVKVDPKEEITIDDIGGAYLRFVEVERACRQFKSIVEAALEEGPIPLPDGRQVAYVESEREKIGAALAMDIMAARLDTNDRIEMMGDVTKSAISRWAKANSARGKKDALIREVMGELRAGGAVRVVPYRQRKVVAGHD